MKKLAALIVALSLLAPIAVRAQTSVGGSSTSPWAINDTCAVGNADSSRVFIFGGYTGMLIKIRCPGASPVRLALQVRTHTILTPTAFLPDSENVGVWRPTEEYSLYSTGATDSLGFGTFRSADAATPGDGEILVRYVKGAAVAGKWNAPDGVVIWLPVRSTYASVRVRVLSANIASPRVKVMVEGTR